MSIRVWEEVVWRKISVMEVGMVGDEPTKLGDLVRISNGGALHCRMHPGQCR